MVGIVLAALGLGALVFGLIEGQTLWVVDTQRPVYPGQLCMAGGRAGYYACYVCPQCGLSGSVCGMGFVAGTAGSLAIVRLRPLALQRLPVRPAYSADRRHSASSVIFVFSIYYQSVRGLTAFDTGVALIPLAITSFIAAPTAGALVGTFRAEGHRNNRDGNRGYIIFLLGMVTNVDTPLWQFAPVFALYGVGVGLAIAQLTNVTLSDIPVQFSGVGSGANNTVRQVGAAIGIAVLGAVLTGQITSTGKEMLAANTTIPAPIKIGITQALDKGLAGEAYQIPGGPGGAGGDQQLGAAIKGIFDTAISEGVKNAATIASIFVLLGAVSSVFIPNPRKEEKEVTQTSQVAVKT